MRVAGTLDTGDMLARARRPIGPDDTSDQVERDLAALGGALLVTVIDRMAAGAIEAERQDDMLATYAHRLTREEGLIDWTLPATYVHNRVRGLFPWPHAYTYLDGQRVILLATHVETADGGPPEEPGTIVGLSRDAIHVATGHGGRLAILQLQPEGRRAMGVRDFLAGHPLAVGARFTSR
jgi:methionyl-tRNA formyltransferase